MNMSLGGSGYSKFENESCEYFYNEKDILIVAAAGNDGDTGYSYPASYDSVMSVGAVDENNVHASFSNFNDRVDLVAPGTSIPSTISGDR